MVMKGDSGAVAKFTGIDRRPEAWQHFGDPRFCTVEGSASPRYTPDIVPCPRERRYLSITLDPVGKASCVWHILSCRAASAGPPKGSAHALTQQRQGIRKPNSSQSSSFAACLWAGQGPFLPKELSASAV